MAILAPSEVLVYAPSVTASGAALNTLLAQAQLIVESSAGCNCPIESQERQEIRKINFATQTVQLSYWPIDFNEPIVVEGRTGNVRNRFHRIVPITQWNTLLEDSYLLDDTGQLSLNLGGSLADFHRSSRLREITEVRVTYTAGVDFSLTTHEVTQLKYAFGGILTAMSSPTVNTLTGVGILEEEDKFLQDRVKYGQVTQTKSPQTIGGISDHLLTPFKKYYPRGHF